VTIVQARRDFLAIHATEYDRPEDPLVPDPHILVPAGSIITILEKRLMACGVDHFRFIVWNRLRKLGTLCVHGMSVSSSFEELPPLVVLALAAHEDAPCV